MGQGRPESVIGYRTSLKELRDKGLAEVVRVEYGPRGGEYRFWRAINEVKIDWGYSDAPTKA